MKDRYPETAIFAYSERGCALAQKIRNGILAGRVCRMYTVKRLCRDGFIAIEDGMAPAGTRMAADSAVPGENASSAAGKRSIYEIEFAACSAMIFISAAGIAVRKIAPYIKDKRTDPAVICIDERGTFVIPLLSGHIGGANGLAGKIAADIGAVAAVTTATDVNGRFAADEWAASHGYAISDMKMAKYIASGILENDLPVCSEFPITTKLPPGTFMADLSACSGLPAETEAALGTFMAEPAYDAGIYIGYRIREPFRHTLRIIPPVLRLGIGCRKGTDSRSIAEAVEKLLKSEKIDRRAVKGVYSIDLKAGEPGLLKFCDENEWKLETYSAEELNKVRGEFSSSPFVQSVTGVDNVCERAAAKEGRLIVRKFALNGVTAALAEEDITIECM